MSKAIEEYKDWLLTLSDGNPIKVAVLINQDIYIKKPEALAFIETFGEDISIDVILKAAEHIVNKKN